MTDSTERNPGPAYRILTPRLVIRCYQPADAPLLIQSTLESREHLVTFMPWAKAVPEPLQVVIDRCRAFRGKFDLGQDYTYGVFTPDETRLIGGTGLHTRVGPDAREIGYWIHKDYTRQGLATEIAAVLTRVAFEIDGMRRVEIHCDARNIASAAVPRKLGYTLEATLRNRLVPGEPEGQPRDMMVWTLQREEYAAGPIAQYAYTAFDSIGRQILP